MFGYDPRYGWGMGDALARYPAMHVRTGPSGFGDLAEFDPERNIAYEIAGVASRLITLGYLAYEHGRDDTVWSVKIASAFARFVDDLAGSTVVGDTSGWDCTKTEDYTIEVSPNHKWLKDPGMTVCSLVGRPGITSGEPIMQRLDPNFTITTIGAGKAGSEEAWYGAPAAPAPRRVAYAGMVGPLFLGGLVLVGIGYAIFRSRR